MNDGIFILHPVHMFQIHKITLIYSGKIHPVHRRLYGLHRTRCHRISILCMVDQIVSLTLDIVNVREIHPHDAAFHRYRNFSAAAPLL